MSASSDTPLDGQNDNVEPSHPLPKEGTPDSTIIEIAGENSVGEGLEMAMEKMALHQLEDQVDSRKDVGDHFREGPEKRSEPDMTEKMKKHTINMVNTMEKGFLEMVETPMDPELPQSCQSLMLHAKNLCRDGIKRFRKPGEDYTFKTATEYVMEGKTGIVDALVLNECKKFGNLARSFKMSRQFQDEQVIKRSMSKVLGPLVGYIEGMMMTLAPNDLLPADVRIAVKELAIAIKNLESYSQPGHSLYESQYTRPAYSSMDIIEFRDELMEGEQLDEGVSGDSEDEELPTNTQPVHHPLNGGYGTATVYHPLTGGFGTIGTAPVYNPSTGLYGTVPVFHPFTGGFGTAYQPINGGYGTGRVVHPLARGFSTVPTFQSFVGGGSATPLPGEYASATHPYCEGYDTTPGLRSMSEGYGYAVGVGTTRAGYLTHRERLDSSENTKKYVEAWAIDGRLDYQKVYTNMKILKERELDAHFAISMLHAFNNDLRFTVEFLKQRNIIG